MKTYIRADMCVVILSFMGILTCTASQRLSPPADAQPAVQQIDPAQAQWDKLVAQWEAQLKLPQEQLKIGEIQKILGQMGGMNRNTKMVKQELSLLQKTPYGTNAAEESITSTMWDIYDKYPQFQEEMPVLEEPQCKLLAKFPITDGVGLWGKTCENNGNVYFVNVGENSLAKLLRVSLRGDDYKLRSKVVYNHPLTPKNVQCVDNYVFAWGGGNGGAIIFPLDQQKPKVLDKTMGLPCDYVTAIIKIGEKLVLALTAASFEDKSSYLVAYDLKTTVRSNSP